ncbi:MAG6450 family protein [Lactiplantibacillus modestisalitolerans]|uniref:MAG6450 family protein n=1 Tax=Lactiplantibacillus modestisalitolerans TaxID=1457219 RepID=A0ABV5WUG5_9LACO|nr:hypothetical protein [Lactiplantibacillus modestisalitolerans]
MGRKLTRKNIPTKKVNEVLTNKNIANTSSNKVLTSKSTVMFKIALTDALISPYTFKKAKTEGAKGFGEFISKTVGRHLTITEVEKLFLRTDGPHGAKNKEVIGGVEREVFHFDNGSRQFRVHGYYNEQNYFCLCRIDPNHKYNYK